MERTVQTHRCENIGARFWGASAKAARLLTKVAIVVLIFFHHGKIAATVAAAIAAAFANHTFCILWTGEKILHQLNRDSSVLKTPLNWKLAEKWIFVGVALAFWIWSWWEQA